MKPFLKWAGGKTALLPELKRRIPRCSWSDATYHEPFVGGGALFFNLLETSDFGSFKIADTNTDVIACYIAIQQHVEALISKLRRFKNTEVEFKRVRARSTTTTSYETQAARAIYLNKTCFNGLYRVNSKGQFNVPFARYKNPTICDAPNLRQLSIALNQKPVRIYCEDFRYALARVEKNDFVYLDPPYVPLHESSDFTSYTAGGFAYDAHERLADEFRKLDREKGAFLMLSNSDTPFVRKLYRGYNIEEVEARRNINAKGDGRGKIKELIIRNYDRS